MSDELDKAYNEVVQATDRAEAQRALDAEDLSRFMSAVRESLRDPNCRHLIREILKWSGLTAPPSRTLDNELYAGGRRSIGWEIKELLDQVDKHIYPDMIKEGVEYEKALQKSG